MYQGHLSDGSSVQKHSAGPLYPFVLYIHEIEGERFWCVIGPGIDGHLRYREFADAESAARRLLAVRSNEDAWAFELEQLCKVADQKLMPMRLAVNRIHEAGVPARFVDMSMVHRVQSLIGLGRVRDQLGLLFAPVPTFMGIAAHLVREV